jgi:DNA transposition AAA+ family ATPase
MGETIDSVLATPNPDHEAIRLALREAAGEDGISHSEIARQAGIGVSTFHAFMIEKYKGNVDSIAKSCRIWLSTRATKTRVIEARPQRSSFVMTPSAEAFHAVLAQAQHEPDMVTICGEPGVGKTEACREYQRRNSNVFILTAEPDMKSAYAVMECLCDVLDVREANSVRRSRAIARFLAGRQALLIIDEAQNIGLPALDQIRAYHDNQAVRVGIALVGHPDTKRRMTGGGPQGKFAQLDSRFGMHVHRGEPLVGDVWALLDAAGITGDEERRYLRAVAKKAGGLRKMDRTIRAARMIARGQDTELVSIEHIRLADAQLSNRMAETV